jgi:hypothetical protein
MPDKSMPDKSLVFAASRAGRLVWDSAAAAGDPESRAKIPRYLS